jgi:hypothetical protein
MVVRCRFGETGKRLKTAKRKSFQDKRLRRVAPTTPWDHVIAAVQTLAMGPIVMPPLGFDRHVPSFSRVLTVPVVRIRLRSTGTAPQRLRRNPACVHSAAGFFPLGTWLSDATLI